MCPRHHVVLLGVTNTTSKGSILYLIRLFDDKKVQVGKDQEKAQSEKDSHSKNQGGKNQTNNQVLIP